jgi:hypothetical protein
MAWTTKSAIAKKRELLQRAKDLGLKVTLTMSEYELEHRIADAEAQLKETPKAQPSCKHGEY